VKPLSDASRDLSVLLLAILFSAGLTRAGQTGKIAGHLTDAQTREPLPGASVVIEGTRLGAAANLEGYYFINNVQPGTYTLSISLVGYQKAIVKNVLVKIDLTTALDVKLSSVSIEASEVVITAERPLVQKDLTSTSAIVSSDELKAMPVENFDQVINLQAGVVAGHFRGGRSDEVLYLVDGVSVTDPYNNGRGFTVENSSIRQMEVISGAFNAEYGQAMSGVVNIVTQEGAAAYHGSLSGYVGDYFTTHTDLFEHLDHYSVPRTRNLEGTFGGPWPLIPGLTFFVTGRYLDQEGYLYGRRMFQTTDSDPYLPTGDSAYVSMNPSNRWSASAKLAYSFGSMKLSVSSNVEHGKNKYYDHAYRWVPDGVMSHYHTSQMHNGQFTHAISPSTFYTLKYTYNFFDYRGYLYDSLYSSRYVDPDRGDPQSNYTFRSGGNYGNRYERNTCMNLVQWSLTSQLSKEHKLGAGTEAQFIRMYSHGYNIVNLTAGVYDSLNNPVFTLGYPRLGAIGNQSYLKQPMQFAAYVQDKMEYDIMIINAGVRFDMFSPASAQPADLKNPTGNTLFPGAGVFRNATKKYQVSPRLGVSFPITDQGIIHFSYGHFFQIPGYDNLYTNSDYLVSSAGSLSTITGNPDLDAQRTVSYEIGLQQVLFDILSLDVTAYYRDIRNYLGMEIIETYDGRSYARYINRDYANVRGFVLSTEKRFSNSFSLRADYTFQIAEGNSSDPRTVYYNNQSDPPTETPKTVVPLSWDQRNTLNLSLMVGNPGDWMASAIFQYGSGTPYTEDVRVSQGIRFENGGTKPPFYNLDLRIEKTIPLFGVNVNAFLWVYNLLDTKNEVNVNSGSGRANIDLFTSLGGRIIGLNTLEQYLNDPTSYSSPREVRLGLSLEF
jgi:outer membrane receptor protein involved in Fe transport